MSLTANSDLFGSVNEEGLNRVITHIMRQRPSLFNYGTAWVAENPKRLCEDIDFDPEVIRRGNPLITVERPLPIFGTNNLINLNFAFQVTKVEVDLHPGRRIALPPELNPPLKEQQFSLRITVCGGIACPPTNILDQVTKPTDDSSTTTTTTTTVTVVPIVPYNLRAGKFGLVAPASDFSTQPLAGYANKGSTSSSFSKSSQASYPVMNRYVLATTPLSKLEKEKEIPPIVLPSEQIRCFCLEVFVVGHFEITGPVGHQSVIGKLVGIEIVNIDPEGLENSFECYLSMLIQLVILPRMKLSLTDLLFDLGNYASITLSATPVSAAVPHNPAVGDDQLKVFVNVGVV